MRTKYLAMIGLISFLWIDNSMALELVSNVIKQNEKIPSQYTCDGKNGSPPIAWKDIPAGTVSLVLIMDDPDAPGGIWDHWVIYNLPPTSSLLPEAAKQLPQGTLLGKNSWQKQEYGGPCPPDREHRYVFKLYAIDTKLPNQAGMTKQEVENAIKGHVIGRAQLVAKYQRTK
jgi:Raf kinase inhibitor-like YbhB/YbcL family protein